MKESNSLFRALPSVDIVLGLLADPSTLTIYGQDKEVAQDFTELPRELLRLAVVDFLDQRRQQIRAGKISTAQELELPTLLPKLLEYVFLATKTHFRRVLNATGVVIHTNLGRSVLAKEATKAVLLACQHYSNLEFDLETGGRGSRYSHVEKLLCQLTGAEAALVVNNNAAAVLLVLDTLCKGREVVVSRGELVEIGGSFRIPDVMERSGCILKEVGATNRTHLKDYAGAIGENTAALLKVHTSNFSIKGFTKSVEREEMCALAKEHGLVSIEDLGSGCLFNFAAAEAHHFAHEPMAQHVIKSGMDVVTMSGDKVLGGPQAGIILGRADILQKIKSNQLTRALRIDKMTLAALEATLRLYLDPEKSKKSIPTLRMMLATKEELHGRAKKLANTVKKTFAKAGFENLQITLQAGVSRVGGGSFPEQDLPTTLVAIAVPDLALLRQNLLNLALPLAVRVENDKLCLDPRTLEDEEFLLVAKALVQGISNTLAKA